MPIVRLQTILQLFNFTYAIFSVTMQYIWNNGVRFSLYMLETISFHDRLTKAITTIFAFLQTTTL